MSKRKDSTTYAVETEYDEEVDSYGMTLYDYQAKPFKVCDL